MSSKLLDTEIGGEQTQYEGITSTVPPHKKSGGQLGTPSTAENIAATEEGRRDRQAQGEQTAEKIRYGQNISESGVGGFTVQGVSNDRVDDSADGRAASGYGGDRDMDKNVGA